MCCSRLKISTLNGETGLQSIFTQFQKVLDYGSLIRVPLFGSSFLKKEEKKSQLFSNAHSPHVTHTHRNGGCERRQDHSQPGNQSDSIFCR